MGQRRNHAVSAESGNSEAPTGSVRGIVGCALGFVSAVSSSMGSANNAVVVGKVDHLRPVRAGRPRPLFRSPEVNIVPMPIQESLRDRLIAGLDGKTSTYQGLERQTAVLLSHERAGDAYPI